MSTILFPYYRKLRKYAPACLLFHDGVVNEIIPIPRGALRLWLNSRLWKRMKLTLLGGLYLLLRFIRNVGEKWNFVLRYGPGGR